MMRQSTRNSRCFQGLFTIQAKDSPPEKTRRPAPSLGDRVFSQTLNRKSKLQARLGSLQYFVDDLDQAPLTELHELRGKDSFSVGLLNGAQKEETAAITEMGPPEAIRFLLKREGRPIPQSDIKEMLKKEMYPMEKLGKGGKYFYTALKRMERNKTIMKEGSFIRLN